MSRVERDQVGQIRHTSGYIKEAGYVSVDVHLQEHVQLRDLIKCCKDWTNLEIGHQNEGFVVARNELFSIQKVRRVDNGGS